MIGTSLGPYKIIEQLGAGGMGEVYLGEDTRLGREVAIKVLPVEFASDPERLARFEQESRAGAVGAICCAKPSRSTLARWFLLLFVLTALPNLVMAQAGLEADREFDYGSRIEGEKLTEQQIRNLARLGKVWGFLKYHHPLVTSGEVHWDYELFRILPQVLDTADRDAANAALLAWVDRLGEPPPCDPCAQPPLDTHLQPDLDWIRDTEALGPALSGYLVSVHENRHAAGVQHYVSLTHNVGNPVFSNEKEYVQRVDGGFRLLALYRFWNIIEYWFPYRDVIGEDWDAVLAEFVPRLFSAGHPEDYRLQLTALIARVRDTHANLRSSLDIRPPRGSCEIPVVMRFVEGRAVVEHVRELANRASPRLEVGDIVVSLDGRPVAYLVEAWSPFYAASNVPTRLRDIARTMTRGECGDVDVEIQRGRQAPADLSATRVPFGQFYTRVGLTHDLPGDAFRLLSDDVAYLKLSSVKSAEIQDHVRAAAGTRALVIDIRNYPSEFVVFSLGRLLVDEPTQFARFTVGVLANPGAFIWRGQPLVLVPQEPHYQGRVVILVDEVSMSQAEYTAMAFRVAPGALVVGSTTAGADGNVSRIPLPGGQRTSISGIGVFYPDKTPTQRVGIVPDVEVHPTIEGIRNGRDEVLEEALRQILGDEITEEEVRRLARGERGSGAEESGVSVAGFVQEWRWFLPGTPIFTTPQATAEVGVHLEALSLLPVLSREGAWVQVVYRGDVAWSDTRWTPPHSVEGARRSDVTDRYVRLQSNNPFRLAKAREILGVSTETGKLGAYSLLTDVEDSELLAFLDAAALATEEAYFARYGRIASGDPDRSVILFAKEADYRRYYAEIGTPVMSGTVGHAGSGIVALFAEQHGRADLARTLAHEITHLLNTRALASNLPPWIEEGIASDLGDIWLEPPPDTPDDTPSGNTISLAVQGFEFKILQLEQLVLTGRLPRVATLNSLDRETFYGDSVTANYSASAAFVRYVLEGDEGRFVEGFLKFLERVAAGHTVDLLEPLEIEAWVLDRGLRNWILVEAESIRQRVARAYPGVQITMTEDGSLKLVSEGVATQLGGQATSPTPTTPAAQPQGPPPGRPPDAIPAGELPPPPAPVFVVPEITRNSVEWTARDEHEVGFEWKATILNPNDDVLSVTLAVQLHDQRGEVLHREDVPVFVAAGRESTMGGTGSIAEETAVLGDYWTIELPPGGISFADPVALGSAGLIAPVQISTVLPEYTVSAEQNGVQGDVYIEAVVMADGTVADPKVIRGLADEVLNQRALDAIVQWRFEPGTRNGVPVAVIALFTVTFRIREPDASVRALSSALSGSVIPEPGRVPSHPLL